MRAFLLYFAVMAIFAVNLLDAADHVITGIKKTTENQIQIQTGQ